MYIYIYIDDLYSVAIWPKHSQVTLIQHLSALVCTLDLHWFRSNAVSNCTFAHRTTCMERANWHP